MKRFISVFCLLAIAVMITGCIESSSDNLVLSGQAPWGGVELKKNDDGSVEGHTAWGHAKLQQDGSRIFGSTAWGGVDLNYNNGRSSGKIPWGGVNLTIDRTRLKGSLPWGGCDLKLDGQDLDGYFPWGTAHLRLGDKYHSLTDPDVILAIAALVSDKT